MSDIKPLEANDLYQRCDPEGFTFETTQDLEDLTEVLGQQRASAAIRFGIGIQRDSYNIYALGESGAGRRAFIDRYLKEKAAETPTPGDWVYVNNFTESYKPTALQLPPGRGVELRDDMTHLVEDLEASLPSAFESEEYRAQRKEVEQEMQQQQEQPLEQLHERAREQGLTILQTPQGITLAPMKKSGEAMGPEEFNQLPDKEREEVRQKIKDFEGELEKILYRVPRLQREGKRKLRELDQYVAKGTVRELMKDVRQKWSEQPKVLEYFDAVQDDVVKNLKDFLPDEGSQQQQQLAMLGMAQQSQRSLRRYRVNVLVDNAKTEGAPIVFENHPSHQNLFGRIEHMSHMGNLFTDFMLIKQGALHRANGGYLILEARKLLTQPFSWETLKRALFSGELQVESLGQELSMISTVSLEPQAFDLRVKVILVGSRLLYQLLHEYDPEFGQLFKVAADFEESMPRAQDTQHMYARMIATVTRQQELMPLDREATARVIEQGARDAEDAERLSVHLQGITDLLRESDFCAKERGGERIESQDVQLALEARRYRAGRVPDKIQEAIRRGTLLIDTEGKKIGQINGLSVSNAGQINFGHASRITARVRLGKGEVKDIQREAELAGPIYSKAVMTLTGYLGAHYAPDFPLMLGASLVFEQTYSGVEGDSATAAELFALLSALSGVPLKQSLAVTGSANQYGDVQPVGGVNEKIEGYFDTCKGRGLTGNQGVLIPAANVKHLMLREDVVAAVREEKFHIFPFSSIDEGLALVTGEDAGELDNQGRFPDGSVNDRVQRRLQQLAEQAKRWASSEGAEDERQSWR